MAMVVVRCVCLGVVLSWYIRLASILVERWRALVVVPVIVLCLFFKSGNRHFITGRSHSTEDERNPPIVPIRGCLEKIRRLLKGDEYVGWGSSQRGLGRRPLCNSCKVWVFGRKLAIQKFTEEIWTNPKLREHLPRLSGERLICRCLPPQECHADSIIAEYKLLFPDAYDREDTKVAVPSSALLRRLSELRQEPESDGGSSPDENGRGSPLLVGSSYTVREVCDGQSLASPGPWAVGDRRYPEDPVLSEVARRYMDYAEKAGTPELLNSSALEKVSSCPFPHCETEELKRGVVDYLRSEGFSLERHTEDRTDVLIDFRYLALMLRASSDPEISLEEYE